MKKAISIVLALLMTLGMFAIAASAAVGLTPEITAKLDEFEALAAEAIADGAYPLDEILAYGASLFTDVDDLDEALAALPDLIANKRAELDAWFTASDWKTGLAGPNAPYATEADELDDKMENGVWIYHYENQVIPNSIDAYNAAVDAAVANAPAFSAVVAAIEALKAFADPSEYIDYWLEDDLEALADLLAQMEDQADLLKAAIKANTVPALGFGYVETVIIPNILGELADLVEEADWNAADKAREDLLEELGDVEDDADLAQLVDALEAADTTEDVWAAIDAINELLDARAAAAEAKALAEALVALEKVIALLEGVETENWLDNATDDYEGDKAALDAALAALQDIAAKFADDYEEDDQPTAAEILEAIDVNSTAAAAAITAAAAALGAELEDTQDLLDIANLALVAANAAKLALAKQAVQALLDDIEKLDTSKWRQGRKDDLALIKKRLTDAKRDWTDAQALLNLAVSQRNELGKLLGNLKWLDNLPAWLGFLQTAPRWVQNLIDVIFGWIFGLKIMPFIATV